MNKEIKPNKKCDDCGIIADNLYGTTQETTFRCEKCHLNKEKKEIKKCACGEQDILGGADVEIGGVCHRGDNPCYVISQEKKEIEEQIEQELRFALGYSGGASDSDILTCETFGGRTSSQRFDTFLEGIMPDLMKLVESYANKKLSEAREKIESERKLKEYPDWQKTEFETGYNQAIDDILSIIK